MAEMNVANLKVFLRSSNANVETRRFTIDASVATSFLFLKEKLQVVFPILQNNTFKITWKDADDDEITISSDEDIITAFTEMSGYVKVLYVTLSQPNQGPTFISSSGSQDPQIHRSRVICDICNQLINGFRYKCIQCPDYDLCAECEHEGHHSDHLMIRLPSSDSIHIPKCARKFMHHIARNLKKTVYAASKEAHHAAKFVNKCSTENVSHNQIDGHNQNSSETSRCPFSSGTPVNMEDIRTLGMMAKQYLENFLANSQTEGSTQSTNNQQGLMSDMIANAVSGFFGHAPQSQVETQNQPKQPTKEHSAEAATVNTGNDSVPMDTEVSVAGGTYSSASTPNFSINTPINKSTAHASNIDPSAPSTNELPINQLTIDVYPNLQNNNGRIPHVYIYHENPIIARGLTKLHEMGFSNEDGYLTRLLEIHQGDVAAVIKIIIETKQKIF